MNLLIISSFPSSIKSRSCSIRTFWDIAIFAVALATGVLAGVIGGFGHASDSYEATIAAPTYGHVIGAPIAERIAAPAYTSPDTMEVKHVVSHVPVEVANIAAPV